MPTLILPKPSKALDVPSLRMEMAAALGVSAPYVDVYDDRIEVVGEVDESMAEAAQGVLDSHTPVPPGPDPQQELVDAVSSLTFEVAMLKFQLGGA